MGRRPQKRRDAPLPRENLVVQGGASGAVSASSGYSGVAMRVKRIDPFHNWSLRRSLPYLPLELAQRDTNSADFGPLLDDRALSGIRGERFIAAPSNTAGEQ